MIFVGNDWAEDHHDVYLMDERGTRLGFARLPEGIEGVARCMRWSPGTQPTRLR